MGIGFIPEDAEPQLENPLPEDVDVPSSMFGLSPRQMLAMGIAGDDVQRLQQNVTEESIRSSAFYVPTQAKVPVSQKQPTTMRRGGGGSGVLTPGQAPPDLPSLLLDSRIVFIGMPLVASVTELIVSELLWLNYNQPEKPVYMYINSLGSQKEQQAVGFETEAYAILDTMNYIRPDVATLAIGQAYGNACMILAAGQKGKRAALPHARIKMATPRINRSFGKTTDIMVKANELEANTDMYLKFLSDFTGVDQDQVYKDCERDKYFTPEQAIEYGLIDRIVKPEEGLAMDAKDYEGALEAMRGQRRRTSAPGGPEAGAA